MGIDCTIFKITMCATVASLFLFATPVSADVPESASETVKTKFSHINGMPIKVGEHKDYYYDYKKFNVSVNPLGPIFGFYSVSGSMALSRHMALRGEFASIEPRWSSIALQTFEIGAPFYFKQMYSGFFLEPGIIVATSDDDESVTGVQIIVGWHWNWDSGYNVMAGFGAIRVIEDDGGFSNEPAPTVLFKVGYNFE